MDAVSAITDDDYRGPRAITDGKTQTIAGNDVTVTRVEAGQHSFIMGAGRVPEIDDVITEMGGWLRSGQISWRETVVEGLERAPEAFLGLLRGENTGKMVIKL